MLRIKDLGLVLALLLLAGCSTRYGAHSAMGTGGYTDKPIDKTSFFIRYQMSDSDAMLTRTDVLQPLWKKRAAELCGSNDFYYETALKRLDAQGNENRFSAPSLVGVAFCNNRFQDTRLLAPDAEFQQAQSIPADAFAIPENNPLWGYLSEKKFDQLEEAVQAMYADDLAQRTPVMAFDNQVESLARIAPSSEALLGDWAKAKPASAMPLLLRSQYYFNYAWFKRGSGYWNTVPLKAQTEFTDLLKKARNDVDQALRLKPDLCQAHALRIDIAKNGRSGYTEKIADLFEASRKVCADSLSLHVSYLYNLYPQWNGSLDAMKAFVESNSQRPALKPLKAWMLAYDAEKALEKQQYDAALASYEEALAILPTAGFYTGKGWVLEKQERYVDAIGQYAKAVQLAPYWSRGYEGLARTLAKQSKFLDALMASFFVSRANAFDTVPYYFQGYVFYEMRRYQDALVSYQSALALEPNKAFLMHRQRATQFQIDVRAKDSKPTPLKTAI